MSDFSLKNVTRVIEEIVAERPYYVYDNGYAGACTYSNADGTPSCLVGHVVYRIDPEFFKELAADEEWVIPGYGEPSYIAGVPDTAENLNYPFDGEVVTEEEQELVRMALLLAQQSQDNGEEWNRALSKFHNAAEQADDA